MIKLLLICEGESEQIFLNELKKQGKLQVTINGKIYRNDNIKIYNKPLKWNKLKRIHTFITDVEAFFFIHDTDDISNIKRHLLDLKNIGFHILYNDPNFDFFICELIGKYPSTQKQVNQELNLLFNKKKKITLKELKNKNASLHNVKNKNKYDILKVIKEI